MFNFLPDDNKRVLEIIGTAFHNCSLCWWIRDDLRLLLSQGVDEKEITKQVTEYYTQVVKEQANEYEQGFFLPTIKIAIAYYFALNGYYYKEVFNEALEIIENELTLFPFADAILYEKKGVNPWHNVLVETFGEDAEQPFKLLADIPEYKPSGNKKSKVPSIIMEILLLDGRPEKKLDKRRAELLRVKEILENKDTKKTKPTLSTVLFNSEKYRFETEFKEGDVVSYKIKSGKHEGKYALFVVDYLRELRTIACDFKRLVKTYEIFALVDKLYDEVPSSLKKPIYKTIEERESSPVMLLECYPNKKDYPSFEFKKACKGEAPAFKRYFEHEEGNVDAVEPLTLGFSTTNKLDSILNGLFE